MSTWVSTILLQQYRFSPNSSRANLVAQRSLPLCSFGSFFDSHGFLLLYEVEIVAPDMADDLVRVVYLAASKAAHWNEHIINYQSPMNDDSFGAAPPGLPNTETTGYQQEGNWPLRSQEQVIFGERRFNESEPGFNGHHQADPEDAAHFYVREIRTCIALAAEDQQKSVE